MSEGYGNAKQDSEGLVTDEGVNERGTDAEAEGPDPDAPGSAVGQGHDDLDAAPEPNEPG